MNNVGCPLWLHLSVIGTVVGMFVLIYIENRISDARLARRIKEEKLK